MVNKYEFSKRETQVVALLLEGKSNKQIAVILGISEGTVEFHLTSIYTKLGVSSRVEAILQLAHPGLSPDLRQLSGTWKPIGDGMVEQGKTPGDFSASNVYDDREHDAVQQGNKLMSKSTVTSKVQTISMVLGIAFALIASVLLYVFLSSARSWSGYTRECEYPDIFTVGQPIGRSGASGDIVHGQFGAMNVEPWSEMAGEVIYKNISTPTVEQLYLKLHYSKNSTSSVPILIYIDEEETPRASIYPENLNDWNHFTWTDVIFLGRVESGVHSIRFSTVGQQYGVADLDSFVLSAGSP